MLPSYVTVNCSETDTAVAAMRQNGFVVIKSAVPEQLLPPLRERMDQDTEELLRYCDSIGGNPRALGHLQQGPPLSPKFVLAEVAMNQYVNAVCTALLGQHATLTFYNGNTNCPGSVKQHLHMDGIHLTRAPEPVHETHSVVVNIPPNPINPANGAIQLWPGTHQVRPDRDERGISRAFEAERAAVEPPIQPSLDVGDVLIRDVRLWHRGVPNPASQPRHMIALIVSKGPVSTEHRLRFEYGCEAALEGHSVASNAKYVDGPIDYLTPPTRRIYEAQKQREAKN